MKIKMNEDAWGVITVIVLMLAAAAIFLEIL